MWKLNSVWGRESGWAGEAEEERGRAERRKGGHSTEGKTMLCFLDTPVSFHQGPLVEGLELWGAKATADPKQSLGFKFWQHKRRKRDHKRAP